MGKRKFSTRTIKHINKAISVIITIAIVLTLALTPGVIARADSSLNGSGTEGAPYRISTIEELKKFRDIINGTNGEVPNIDACAVLTEDIDLEGDPNNASTWWTPIGANDFRGVFDGQGHAISNLYVNLQGDYVYGGLFSLNSGIIKNLCVSGNVSATGDGASAGGIAGSIHDEGQIKNCRSDVNVEARRIQYQSAFAGGIVGIIIPQGSGGIISNCISSGTVTGSDYAGGIIGHTGAGSVTYCYSCSTVTGADNFSGGVVGYSFKATITNCYYNTTTAGTGVKSADGDKGNTETVKGLTADECKDSSNFVGFDFNNVWFMGESGPKLWMIDVMTVSSWSTLKNALQKNGKYVRLNADVSAPEHERLTVPSGKTVTLDLCGHTITGNGSGITQGRTEVLLVQGTLTLTDSGTTPRYGSWNEDWSTYTLSTSMPASGDCDVFPTGGVITEGSSWAGGGVRVETGGSFIMKGGAIAGNSGTYSSSSGGGLYVDKDGVATLNGGMICGNYAEMGGGVCVVGGSFELKRGTIGRNIAERGGGVHVMGAEANDTPKYGVFTMNGGSIAGNKATSSTYGGGGVCISHIDLSPGGTFTMNAGTIANNEATSGNGGGVLVTQEKNVGDKNSTFTMTGGTITGNSASSDSSDGGGVYVNTGCEFQLSVEAEIMTNTAGSSGGGVYVNTGGNFQPSAGVEITENTAGGEVDDVYYETAAAFTATGADTGTLSGLTNGGHYIVSGAARADFTLTGETSYDL
ncbi:MAG: hypothetical protein ILP08_03015, partial [Lachnospiraceae bacterium]|nr:hypothetical protein [Lachnospiraceae bacterium]